MREKFKNLPERDKMLLVILLFVAIFAGMFTLHTKLQDEQVSLTVENEGLINQKNLLQASTMDIAKTELELEAKLEEIEALYSKVPDNIDSSVDFETLFLSWIEGRNVRIDTFSYVKPEEIRVEAEDESVEAVFEDQLDNVAGQLDGLNEVGGDVDYNETSEPMEGTPVAPTEGTPTEGEPTEAAPLPIDTPSIQAASFNYKLEMSRYEYTRLLDMISQQSEFYQLTSTEFSVGEDGSGSGLISIRVFSFSKPERFKSTDASK